MRYAVALGFTLLVIVCTQAHINGAVGDSLRSWCESQANCHTMNDGNSLQK